MDKDAWPERLLRINQIVGRSGLIPVSRSTWYAMVAAGRAPKPIKLGRVSLWRVSDVRALIAEGRQDV